MIVGTMEAAEQGYMEFPPILREALDVGPAWAREA